MTYVILDLATGENICYGGYMGMTTVPLKFTAYAAAERWLNLALDVNNINNSLLHRENTNINQFDIIEEKEGTPNVFD